MSRFFFVHPDVKLTPRGVARFVLISPELPLLGCALATIVAVVLVLAGAWRSPAPQWRVTQMPITYEVGSEESGISVQKHLRRSDGSLRQTLINYENGNLGTINYRSDSTAHDFTITAEDGTHMLESTYDADGKTVVKGFELRPDRSLLWQIETLASDTVKTVVFWRDGKQPFSVRLVNGRDNTTDLTYFRQDGKMWVHQTLVGSTGNHLRSEELYSAETGLLERSRRQSPDSSREEVTFYGANGIAVFKLTWVTYTSEHAYWVDLDNTVVFEPDGRTPALIISWFRGGQPKSIALPNADGTLLISEYGSQGELRGQRLTTKQHVLISSTKTGADPNLPARIKPEYYAQNKPDQVDPVPVWKDVEAKSL